MSYAQVQPSSHPISILESEEYLLPVRWCTENLALQVSRSQHKDSLWAPSTAFQVLDTTIVASWLGESCPKKKWKNMGKPGGKHGKNHGKSLFFTSEILGNNDVRESGPVPWDRPNAEKMIEKSFQDGKQKDMFLSFFRIASVLSIWIYLAIGFLWWHVYFLPAIPSPWSKLAHCTRKKNTSHCCCASSQNTKAVDKSCGIQRVGDRRSLSTRKRSWINWKQLKLHPRSKL